VYFQISNLVKGLDQESFRGVRHASEIMEKGPSSSSSSSPSSPIPFSIKKEVGGTRPKI